MYVCIYVKYIDILPLVPCINAFVFCFVLFFIINLILTVTLHNVFFCCKLFQTECKY